MTISAYHIYQTPGPRRIGWQCDVADGNDETIAEGHGKTPETALESAKKVLKKHKCDDPNCPLHGDDAKEQRRRCR